MFGHLKDEALMDVLEGAGSKGAARHLEGCGSCAQRLRDAREGWALARDAAVPDPGPAYWEAFRRGVEGRIREDEVPSPWPSRWLWPAMAATTAAAAGLLMAVLFLEPSAGSSPFARPTPARVVPAWTPTLDMATVEPFEAAVDEAALGAECRDLAECLIELSAEDAVVLADLLEEGAPEGRP